MFIPTYMIILFWLETGKLDFFFLKLDFYILISSQAHKNK